MQFFRRGGYVTWLAGSGELRNRPSRRGLATPIILAQKR